MMNWLRAIVILTTCLLTSCLDCREEVWLNADGSGRVDISYTIPAAVAKLQGGEEGLRKMLGKLLSETKELHSTSYTVTTVSDRLTVRVKAAFDSALDLKNASQASPLGQLPSSATHLSGILEVKLRGRSLDLKRTISPGSALPGVSFMPASTFTGHRLSYIIHLPLAAKQSNATRIENGGKTLIWDFPLGKAIKQPVTTHFIAPIPIPGRAILTMIFVLLLLLGIGSIIFRRLKRISL